MAADLHCHTKISDGSASIEEVISMAKRSRIKTISITDHDSFAGTVRGKILGDRYGVEVIPGVEFSAFDKKRGQKVHLLAYLCDSPGRLEGLCQRTSVKRKKAALAMINGVMKEFPITPEMVAKCATGSTNIFKCHIMHALMNAGCADKIFGSLYFDLFSSNGGKYIVEPEYPDVFEVLEEAKGAGAVVVMAHPSVYNSLELIPELAEKGLDGVEVWHPRNKSEDLDKIRDLAKEHDLLMTGGTDFHGMYTMEPMKLGSYMAPEEHLKALLARKKKQSKV